MASKRLPFLALGGVLLAAALFGPAPEARAQGCLSAAEARNAVQSGQALPLSRMLKAIRKAAGGEILPPPQLCDAGGRLVYYVNVLGRDGQVTQITVDAASGSILGY